MLLDISCIWRTSESETIQDAAFEIWSKYPSSDPFEEGLSHDIHQELHIDVIGQHHFITENGALLPKFNLTNGNEDCFIVANKSAGAHAPVNSQENVDWLELKRANIPNPGQLANEVYRVFTKGGQPPRSVSPSQPCLSTIVTIVYSAKVNRLSSRSSTPHNIVRTNDLMISNAVFDHGYPVFI